LIAVVAYCGLTFSMEVVMKFFVPAAKDAKQTEEVWGATKKFAEQNLGWEISDRRVLSIEYVHDGQNLWAEVGHQDPRTKEPVIVILESGTYLVCTPNRGVLRGMPMLVGHNEVRRVVYFDDSPK
jgi:hypothetical protein